LIANPARRDGTQRRQRMIGRHDLKKVINMTTPSTAITDVKVFDDVS
jgi:hypothetical protein